MRFTEPMLIVLQVLLVHGSSPSTRSMPAPTTSPKPTPGECTASASGHMTQATVILLCDWLGGHNTLCVSRFYTMMFKPAPFCFLQFQPDRHSSVRALRQTLRQVAHGHRGDVRLRCGVRPPPPPDAAGALHRRGATPIGHDHPTPPPHPPRQPPFLQQINPVPWGGGSLTPPGHMWPS